MVKPNDEHFRVLGGLSSLIHTENGSTADLASIASNADGLIHIIQNIKDRYNTVDNAEPEMVPLNL